jgi:hypothetical protein
MTLQVIPKVLVWGEVGEEIVVEDLDMEEVGDGTIDLPFIVDMLQ